MSDKTLGVLEDLVDALRENSELLRGMTAKAKANLPADAKGKADDGDKPKTTRTAKAKVPTAKDLATATTAFLEVTDEDEYAERKGIVKKIVAKYDVAKMSEIEEADRTEAMALLQVAIDGGNPFKKARRDDDDDMA